MFPLCESIGLCDVASIVVTLAAATTGAFFRRWFGGGFVSAPRWLRVAAGLLLGGVVAFLATSNPWAAPAGVVAAVTWTLGHGSYMDMGRMDRPDNEFLAPILDRIFGVETEPSELRDFTGMAIVYSLLTVPAGIGLIALGHAGWFMLPVGTLVACAYWLAWELPGIEEPTVPGEYAAGALIYGALALA